MLRLFEVASYVLVPLAWGLAVEAALRWLRRRTRPCEDRDELP